MKEARPHPGPPASKRFLPTTRTRPADTLSRSHGRGAGGEGAAIVRPQIADIPPTSPATGIRFRRQTILLLLGGEGRDEGECCHKLPPPTGKTEALQRETFYWTDVQ